MEAITAHEKLNSELAKVEEEIKPHVSIVTFRDRKGLVQARLKRIIAKLREKGMNDLALEMELSRVNSIKGAILLAEKYLQIKN